MSKVVTVTFKIYGEEKSVEGRTDQSLLEIALENGLNPNYSCMEGVCGACRAKVLEGQVEEIEEGWLSKEEIEKGDTLTCQARPKAESGKLVIEFP